MPSYFLLCLLPLAVLASPHLEPRQVVFNSSAKAGLPWPNGDTASIDQFAITGRVGWYYTWNPMPVTTDMEFVPMLWGSKSVAQFQQTINSTIRNHHVKAVLGMNEPQQKDQANISAADAVDLWKRYIEPLKSQGIRLGSPAPSNAASGRKWLQDFFTLCAGQCTVDFIALHFYGVNADAFISYIKDFHATFQKPLWITEFACQNYANTSAQCNYNDVVQFLNKTQTFLECTPYVERYSWFGAARYLSGVNQDNALMDKNGRLNALGEKYINCTEPCPIPDWSPPHNGKGNRNEALSFTFSKLTVVYSILSTLILSVLVQW